MTCYIHIITITIYNILGTAPGVGGGGGGGASYIYSEITKDFIIIGGDGNMPGGLMHNIPEAVGCGKIKNYLYLVIYFFMNK